MLYEQEISIVRLSDGDSGRSSFVHIKYSNDGKTFTTNNGEDIGSWLGIYTDDKEEESTVFSDYKWSKILGATGAVGTGIDNVTKEFYLSNSKTTQSGGSWQTNMPEWSYGKYLWVREKIVYKNPTSTVYTTPSCDSSWEAANVVDKKVTTLQTDFKVEQGKIESLIENTTIDNGDGTTTTLKDAYNQTKSTVEGNKTTIANIKTSVDDVTGKVTTMDSRITKVESTADGLKTTVSKASTDAENALSTASQTADKFQWMVKSGTSSTDFLLTDRTAQLVADSINLHGLVTFKGLDSSTQNKITETSNKIDNLQIGGRNLLKNSHSVEQTYSYPSSNYVDQCNWVTSIPLNGDTYTLSFWAKSTVAGDTIRVHFYSPSNITHCVGSQGQVSGNIDGQCDFTLSTVLTKYWVTYTIPKGGNSARSVIIPRMFSGSGKGTVSVKWEKLEEGNKATDWTPAPEDKADQSIIDNWAKDSVVSGETTINGGYIKTNTIKTDQLAVDDIFATGSAAMNIINAQEINANRITSGLLSAERINAYGLSILNKTTNQQTFNISNNGEVTIRGSVSSSNYNIGKTGWSINNDGTAEFNDIIARGSVITNDGGIVSSGGTGRNLLSNSQFLNSFVIEDGTASTWQNNVLTRLDNGNAYRYGIYYDFTNIKKNTSYAFSINIEELSANGVINLCVGSFVEGSVWDNYGIVNISSIGRRSISFTTKANETKVRLYIASNVKGTKAKLINAKLEEGSIATDWSPAPEDKLKQVRFWAGTSFEDRESAPFIVYSDGSIKATQGEYSGLWTGDIKIGNISIVDPSASAGNDALLTIQNGANGVKRVQLTDNMSSSFAQDIVVTNNTYSPMISLKQDGSAYFSRGINIADKTTLNSSGLIINNKTLTTTSNGSGFLFNNELNIGTANQSANLIVHGNTSTDNITVDNTLYFGDILKFTKNANGINIDFI